LDVEDSDLLTHALTTLVGKLNGEYWGGGDTMDTQWKQVKHITLSSVKTLEDLTTRLEDMRDCGNTLPQTLGTNLESVMLKAGYDEDLDREWVHMSHLYWSSLLGFQCHVGLHTHLWKIATTYSLKHAELQMDQYVKVMRQLRQSHGTRLQVVCLNYIYFRDQLDKGFRSYKLMIK
jgi:hypothetical protein